MKQANNLILLLFFSFTLHLHAQNVGINSTGTPPDASAILDVSSSNKGLLLPRMTTTQRNAIVSPALSLMIFNTTTNCFEAYVGGSWNSISCPIACVPPIAPSSITGNSTIPVNSPGLTYSISSVIGATSYTWTVPTGFIVTAGQGSTSVTVTSGIMPGNISVTASNTCGTSTPSTLAVSFVFSNCNEILTAIPGSTDGVYTIDPDGIGSLPSMSCQCDMTTDGGGWTLILNYLHQGGTSPVLNIRTNSLPLFGSNILGVNEGGTSFWGHSSNSLLNNFNFTDVRFFGKTNTHPRVIHFKTSHVPTINYFKTGTGTCSGIQASFIALAGHTANLPAAASSFFINQGNLSMTEFPYYVVGTYHWGIKGIAGGPNRWEVDNTPPSTGHTFHQIWIR